MNKNILNIKDYFTSLQKKNVDLEDTQVSKKIPLKYIGFLLGGRKEDKRKETKITNRIMEEIENGNKTEFTQTRIIEIMNNIESINKDIDRYLKNPLFFKGKITLAKNNIKTYTDTLFSLFKVSPIFSKTIENMNLSNDILGLICEKLLLIKINKHEYLAKYSENIDKYYILIKGEIGIYQKDHCDSSCLSYKIGNRIDFNHISNENKSHLKSLVAIEESWLLYLNKNTINDLIVFFNNYKNTICNSLRNSLKVSNKVYNILYKRANYIQLSKNDIVYSQNTPAKYFIILLSGELLLKKEILKKISKTVLIIKPIDLVGHESIINLNSIKEINYKHTLISNSNSEILQVYYEHVIDLKKELLQYTELLGFQSDNKNAIEKNFDNFYNFYNKENRKISKTLLYNIENGKIELNKNKDNSKIYNKISTKSISTINYSQQIINNKPKTNDSNINLNTMRRSQSIINLKHYNKMNFKRSQNLLFNHDESTRIIENMSNDKIKLKKYLTRKINLSMIDKSINIERKLTIDHQKFNLSRNITFYAEKDSNKSENIDEEENTVSYHRQLYSNKIKKIQSIKQNQVGKHIYLCLNKYNSNKKKLVNTGRFSLPIIS